MSVLTTYFSIVDTAGLFADSNNAVDNNIGTVATYESLPGTTLILDTPAASASGTISKVEIRIFGSLNDNGVPAKLYLSPRFAGGRRGSRGDFSNGVGVVRLV